MVIGTYSTNKSCLKYSRIRTVETQIEDSDPERNGSSTLKLPYDKHFRRSSSQVLLFVQQLLHFMIYDTIGPILQYRYATAICSSESKDLHPL